MSGQNLALAAQLKETCKLTRATWAVWVQAGPDGCRLGVQHGLSERRRQAVEAWTRQAPGAAWLGEAFQRRAAQPRPADSFSDRLGCAWLYLFPHPTEQGGILAGAGELEAAAQETFRIIALGGGEGPALPDLGLDEQVLFQPLEIEMEPSYDLEGVLKQVLRFLCRGLPCDAAYIALRAGETFQIKTTWNLPEGAVGVEMSMQESDLLAEMVERRQALLLPDADQRTFPAPGLSSRTAAWLGAPIVLGQRVIGFAAFIARQPGLFTESSLHQASLYVERVAYLVENAIVFAEAARYLQQLALVNELASAASSGTDTDQVARRVLRRLRRVFGQANVSLLLLSQDGKSLREYGDGGEAEAIQTIELSRTTAGRVVESGRPLRSGNVKELSGLQALRPQSHSELSVPLKVRGSVIGVLAVTSPEYHAFSTQDEQLLVMIASHLAGLVENVRLYEEARQRARNLSLIHQVVQRVVGLNEMQPIAQVAAELMVEQFDYQAAGILLLEEYGKELTIQGSAARQPGALGDLEQALPHSRLAWQVLRDGASRMETVEAATERYTEAAGHSSLMCVPLMEGARVSGVIHVQRDRPNAFNENDLLALEALAGVLSSVMMNARRYQELQTNVRQLQAVRETALDIAADLDLDALLRRVVHRAKALVGARGGGLALVDPRGEFVRMVVSENPWQDTTGTEIPFMAGLEGQVAALGEPLVIADYNAWSGRLNPEKPAHFRAVAGIPLKLKGQVIGVLSVSDDRPGYLFRPGDLQILELLAPQVAIFIRNARLYQELQERVRAQRAAESQLVRSARLAAVGEMAAGVAHELNNPLTTVSGFIELALEELPADSPQREDLQLVLREARRARGVVRRLLDFSRPGENLRVRSDVNELVGEVLTLVQHLVRTNGIEMRIQLWDDLPWINIDPNQIKQVLLNLLHNAIQAMPTGGTLTIQTAHQQRSNRDWLTIAIQDSGVGISPEALERIFEPFYTTRQVGAGTGLGLSVSYGIVNEHGGFIEVESQVNRGSTFTVWLKVDGDG